MQAGFACTQCFFAPLALRDLPCQVFVSGGELGSAFLDPALEDRERHRAVLQDLVELLDVELRAEDRLGLFAGA